MNKTAPPLFKLAISSKDDRLKQSDYNALDDFALGIARRGFALEVITHDQAGNLADVEKWATENSIPIRILQTKPVGGRADRPSPARLLAIMADGCARLGDEDEIAQECKAAGVPVWTFFTFTTRAKPTSENTNPGGKGE